MKQKRLALKYSDNGKIRYIQPWVNFLNTVPNLQGFRAGEEALKEYGGKQTEERLKLVGGGHFYQQYLEFETPEQLTYWMIKWA